jgi:hypothetical protein
MLLSNLAYFQLLLKSKSMKIVTALLFFSTTLVCSRPTTATSTTWWSCRQMRHRPSVWCIRLWGYRSHTVRSTYCHSSSLELHGWIRSKSSQPRSNWHHCCSSLLLVFQSFTLIHSWSLYTPTRTWLQISLHWNWPTWCLNTFIEQILNFCWIFFLLPLNFQFFTTSTRFLRHMDTNNYFT